jgi:hypothetical protein
MGEAMSGDRNDVQRQAMRACLEQDRPGSPALALRYLRDAFPDAALADRVRAFADWRSAASLAA